MLSLSVLASCQEGETSEVSSASATESTQADTESSSNTESVSVPTEVDEKINFKGFIGNSPISAYLEFDENQGTVTGYYYYDKYGKHIDLNGGETDWYGGPIYGLEETTEDGKVTGEWVFMMMDDYGAFTARFKSPDGENDLDIIIKSTESGGYLDPDSKMLFKSDTHAANFFIANHFHHNTTKHRCGVILHELDQDEYMTGSKLLPTGITVYDHDGSDGFGVEPVGLIQQNNIVQYSNGEEYNLYDWDWDSPHMMEIDYEVQCLRFYDVATPEYVYVSTNEGGFYLSIKELNDEGYYLEGDGYWLVQKSGNVLGYYPNGNVTMYDEKKIGSKEILSVSDDHDGYFAVNDVVNYKKEVWAFVTFEYFTEVPCDGTIRDPEPPVTGWIQLYEGPLKNYLKLGFYSRGC